VGATGSVRVSLMGAGFGTASRSIRVRLPHTAAEATAWTSDSTVAVRAAAPGSVRRSMAAVVTSGLLRRTSVTHSLSFDLPSLLSYRPPGGLPIAAPVWERNRGSGGGSRVSSLSIHGAAFACSDSSPRAAMGSTHVSASVWTSDTTLVCRCATGVGRSRRLSVSAGGMCYSHTSIFSYDLHGAMSLVVSHGANRPSTGSASVSVLGHSFGILACSHLARIAPTASEGSMWVSDTSLTSLAAAGASGRTRRVVMTAGQQVVSLSGALSYCASSVSTLEHSNTGSTGSVSITVMGVSLAAIYQPSAGVMSLTSVSCLWCHVSCACLL
jgi:hypothetical protein